MMRECVRVVCFRGDCCFVVLDSASDDGINTILSGNLPSVWLLLLNIRTNLAFPGSDLTLQNNEFRPRKNSHLKCVSGFYIQEKTDLGDGLRVLHPTMALGCCNACPGARCRGVKERAAVVPRCYDIAALRFCSYHTAKRQHCLLRVVHPVQRMLMFSHVGQITI